MPNIFSQKNFKMNKFKNLNSTLRIALCLMLLGSANQVAAEPDDPLNQLLRQRQQQSSPTPQRDEEGLNRLIQNSANNNPSSSRFNIAPPSNTAAISSAPANSKSDADRLISNAMGFIGVAYRFGGTTPRGFDCSGFMQYVFQKAFAVNLPRTAAQQATAGVQVSRANLQAGDMVFFRTSGRRISHVGMYVGNGRFIHAPRTGKRIEITNLNSKYWSARYATARRVKRNNAQNFIRN